MAVNPTDVMPAAVGMATALPAADVPKTHAQSITGFVPGRNGKLSLAPLLKRLPRSYTSAIYGTAVWLSESGQYDRLLLITSTTVYSMFISSPTPNTYWKHDEREDGPHSYYALADSSTLTTVGTHGYSSTVNEGVYSIQFGQELILSIGGGLFRYYVDGDGLGTETFYKLGLNAPISSLGLSSTTGGSMTSSQTYSYEFTWVDELDRESSPSPTNSITLSASGTAVSVDRSLISVPSNRGITYWNLYRLNPGATVYKFVAQIAAGTTSYTDTASDDTVNANDPAPEDGENDAPDNTSDTLATPVSNVMCIWKNRLVLNSITDPNMVQVSNAGSPTQFSSLPLPTNLDDGLRIEVGGHGQNQVTGLANLGSLLCVFGRETTSLLYGDDISDFTLRETLQRGCQNPNSIQRCENEVLFLSDNGVYAIGYESGYAVQKRSSLIDDIFLKFQWVQQEGQPTSKWRYETLQTLAATINYCSSFYSDNRYYLSIGNRTLCMDVLTGGWSDTGWGFVKTVTRYNSQQLDPLSSTTFSVASNPETLFLTFGDPTTWSTDLYYFTAADTPGDRDAPASVTSEIVMRPFGADPAVQTRKRRVTLLSQYGSCGATRGEVIGTIAWTVDGYTFPATSLYAWIATARPGALFEVSGPITSGQVVYPTLTFTRNDIELQNAIPELVYLN